MSDFTHLADLDVFSQNAAKDAMTRWTDNYRDYDGTGIHMRHMRIGWIVLNFSDHELWLLDELGFLCPMDQDDLRAAGRLT